MTLQSVAHKAGVFHQRRFEPAARGAQGNSHYDVKLGYPSSHQFALNAVPVGSSGPRHRSWTRGDGAGSGREGLPGCGRRPVPGDGDAPGEVEVLQQDLNDPPGVRRPQVRLPADARRDRASQATRSSSWNSSATSSTTRPASWCSPHPTSRSSVQRLMLALGQFNYGDARNSRPHPHPPVHLPQPAPAARRRRPPDPADHGCPRAMAEGPGRWPARPDGACGSTSC